MRIEVENILGSLEQGATVQEILEEYPELELEDMRTGGAANGQ